MISAESSAMPNDSTVPVPLSALSLEGVPPTQGDSVAFSVTGRVVSVDGQTARIQPETINDQPVLADAGAEDRAMLDAAMQADSQAGY